MISQSESDEYDVEFREKRKTYYNLELQTRQKLSQDYFSHKRTFQPWKDIFENHFTQNYQNQQDTQENIHFKASYAKRLLLQIQDEIITWNFLLQKDYQYLVGSARFLQYFDKDQKKCQLKVCDIYFERFCPFQFLISVPYQLNKTHFEKLESLFNNRSLASRFQKQLQQQNEEAILLKDIADSRFQTYVIINEVLQLNEDKNLIAFEDNQIIYYFELITKKNQKFTFKNLEDEITFVVGVQDQDKINENIHMYQMEDGIDNKKQIKKNLYTFIMDQEDVEDILLIQLEKCRFGVLVYPNNDNKYSLKVINQEELYIFDDLQTYVLQYEKILGQLHFEKIQGQQNSEKILGQQHSEKNLGQLNSEKKQWKLNCNKENHKFYKKINRYPNHFSLCARENIIIRARDGGNFKLESIQIGKQ